MQNIPATLPARTLVDCAQLLDAPASMGLLDTAGRFVARIDLAWPERRRGLEYDGREFHGLRPWEADELRQARIEALGWRVDRVEKVDLLDGADGSGPCSPACWLRRHDTHPGAGTVDS